jgi:hypothetical protein
MRAQQGNRELTVADLDSMKNLLALMKVGTELSFFVSLEPRCLLVLFSTALGNTPLPSHCPCA